MTNVQPPLNRPTPENMDKWKDWSDREILVAILIRHNAMAGMLMQMAEGMPDMLAFMSKPMVRMAMNMVIKADKSNEG